MDTVDIKYAKEHLDELTERAKRGEDISIGVPGRGRFRISYVGSHQGDASQPMKRKIKLGLLEGKLPPPPDGFFDPLSEEELKDWYGDDA